MTQIIETRNLVMLGYLEEIFTDLGYVGTQLLDQSAELSIPSLLVPLDTDKKGRARFISLMFYPAPELEDTLLLQYYIEMPFPAEKASLPDFYALLPALNHKAVVGYFGFGDSDKPYYRYVQALRADQRITKDHVTDVIALIVTTTDLLQDVLEDVASGKSSVEEGRKRVSALLRT